jgi:ring-1,2-phenylacetyl-CoA epoxidase subunit PaaD
MLGRRASEAVHSPSIDGRPSGRPVDRVGRAPQPVDRRASFRTPYGPRLQARAAAARVTDPEIPVLTIDDLGILREVDVDDSGRVTVTILPTYSGCPAMSAIKLDIETELAKAGFEDARVVVTNTPAWTTDFMSEAARAKLRAYGISPPERTSRKRALFEPSASVACPRCGSRLTERISEFGSTACKALWRCRACREPFDHFKCV